MLQKCFLFFILSGILLSSCATYHISTESLLEQFAGVQKEKKITVFLAPPYFFYPGVVDGNTLRYVKVLDKQEKSHTYNITQRMNVSITQNSGKRTTFISTRYCLKIVPLWAVRHTSLMQG